MSEKYNEYLTDHINNVMKAYQWMVEHDVIPSLTNMSEQLMQHDISKYSPEEYDAYDDYFYGKDGADEDDAEIIDHSFDYAWLHHIHNNPHHWQYWVLVGDDDGAKALSMPIRYVIEMICDWWAFSWKSGNLGEIFEWYENHKKKMILHPETRDAVESILNKINDALKTEAQEDENG